MPSTALLIANARVSSPAIAAGAVRWKNDSTKLASDDAEDDAAGADEARVGRSGRRGHAGIVPAPLVPGAPWYAATGSSWPRRSPMKYADLRDFLAQLERRGELKRVRVEVDPRLEMTEICDRVLKAGGPALLFEQPKGFDGMGGRPRIPVLGNLFGTPQRVALGMGEESVEALREVGKLLAFLKEPEPPKGLKDAWQNTRPVFLQVMHMAPKERRSAPCQEVVWEGADVDLARLPVQTCWPGDAGPLITWGLTVTRGPHKARQNLGIYRQQVLQNERAQNKVIMRWLAHRGGALDFRDHAAASPGEPFPIAVALGADPATILGAVTPVPDTLSEYQFAGLLRGVAHRDRQVHDARPLRAGDGRDRARGPSSGPTRAIRPATRRPPRDPSATTPATTTRSSASRCSRSSGSRCAAIRSTTRRTPASRPTSRRCWASR